jgi:hypothetical protein
MSLVVFYILLVLHKKAIYVISNQHIYFLSEIYNIPSNRGVYIDAFHLKEVK